MSEHTPGPWFVNWAGRGKDGHFVYDEVYVYAPSCGVDDIAVAADIADPLTGEPSIFNAQLIAAAPELLALLIESQDSIGGDWRERRDAAIAKATGRQP